MEEGLATLLDDFDKLMMTKAKPKNVKFVKKIKFDVAYIHIAYPF